MFHVKQVSWSDAEAALRLVRTEVFIDEQRVPEPEEWDGRDEDAVHVLAVAPDGTPIGTGRLLREGDTARVGRMAVRRPWRGRGVGDALLRALLDAARERGSRDAVLDSQLHAIPFYARHGFVAEGPRFLDAGIVHRRMRRSLQKSAEL